MTRSLALAITAMLTANTFYARTATAEVPMAKAIEAAQSAVGACRANGYNVTATVLDSDLSTRVVLRGDGAPETTVEIARRKAYTVIKTGMSSGDFGKTVPAPPTRASPQAASRQSPGTVNGDPNLITWAGGVPIKSGDKTVGSISVSGAAGGDKDEACANAGLAKIAGKLR
jgi:uncharacterized protein GlcG (DUF336 family)